METKKVGWYVLLFGIALGIIDYFDVINYLTGNPVRQFVLSERVLTAFLWGAIALIIVGALMIKFGRNHPLMPRYY